MKGLWRVCVQLIAIGLLCKIAWGAVAMAETASSAGSEPDQWGLTASDWSNADGLDLLTRAGGANSDRHYAIEVAAQRGDPKAMLLLCIGYEEGFWGFTDYNNSVGWCKASAEAKFPRGMRNYALGLEIGLTNVPDKVTAKRLYREAAEAGNGRAMENYGVVLEEGWDAAPDLSEATSWYCWAADKGVVTANVKCGWGLQFGWRHGAIDLQNAVKYYRNGAWAGDPAAMAQYGYMLESGTGTPKDQCEATRWHRAAAEAGEVLGMENYGLALQSGRCTATDYQGALNWYQRAVAAGSTKAGAWYDNLNSYIWQSYAVSPPPPPERNYQEWCLSHHSC
jgi:TPR repeat protein